MIFHLLVFPHNGRRTKHNEPFHVAQMPNNFFSHHSHICMAINMNASEMVQIVIRVFADGSGETEKKTIFSID